MTPTEITCPNCDHAHGFFLSECLQEQGTRFNCAHCGIDYLAFPSGLTVEAPIADDPREAILEPVVIHGWDADRVQERQARHADALGIPVVFRDRLADGSPGPEMVLIPSGIYIMGSPPDEPERDNDEGPQHQVTIAQPFAIGRYALTFAEWDTYASATGGYRPWDEDWGRGSHPVINVNWKHAQQYLRWLVSQTGQDYRLPSESEWEYACRAGTTTRFHTGDCITTDHANFNGNNPAEGCPAGRYLEQTAPVGSYPPNLFGLHDMHGNIFEWVADCWKGSYIGAPVDGSPRVPNRSQVVLRGGSWYLYGNGMRSAHRYTYARGARNDNIGIRVARTVSLVTMFGAKIATSCSGDS